MQRYQPPHMRQRTAQPSPSNSTTDVEAGSSRSVRPPGGNKGREPYTPRTSQRDWSKPTASSYSLASPAADLQPMRRSPMKTDIDDMELIQSVSRSGGDGAEGDALKDWSMQEKYRRYIDERLDKHYSTFPRPRHTPPLPSAQDELHSLGSIVLLFRKLREGVVASHRGDDFAVEVFESSARLAILARSPPQLLSSLSGLVPGLYTAVHAKGKARETDVLDQITHQMRTLDIHHNQAEFVSVLLLYHLAHNNSRQAFHSTLIELTDPTATQPRSPFLESHASPDRPKPFIDRSRLQFASRAAKALSDESFNPSEYFRLISDPNLGSSYERAVLRWNEDQVRERSWKILSKAYIDCDISWAGRWIGLDDGNQDWMSAKGAKIEGRKVRLR